MKIDFVYNNKMMKCRRRQLRSKPTETEELLWGKIRKSQLGYKFDRQYSISGFVMDFYCPAKRLAIEIDGEIHKTKETYDKYRDRWLTSADIKVIHFQNEEVVNNIRSVLKRINMELGCYL